jgi:predicted Zn finger-like uncharacterized protein
MIIQCPKCKGKYKINNNDIPPGGGAVKCPSCNNIFTVYKEPLNIELIPYIEGTEEEPSTSVIAEKSNSVSQDFEKILETSSNNESLEVAEPLSAAQKTYIHDFKETDETHHNTSNDKISALWEKFKNLSGESKPHTIEKESPVQSPSSTENEEKPSNISDKKFASLFSTDESPVYATETPVENTGIEIETAAGIAPEVISDAESKEHEKAKKLAKALAKDITLYYGDKVKQGLEQGNLVELIGSEIKKSWKFYQQKTPIGINQNTTYFEDALNDIVAQGKKLFKFH